MKKASSNFITKSTLKGQGWTDALIKEFLPEPDKEVPNPHYRSAPPMCLYDRGRVKQIQKTKEFLAKKKIVKRRKISAATAAETKRQNLFREIQKVSFDVEILSRDELLHEAIENHNQLVIEHPWWDEEMLSVKSDPHVLARIQVNYLRHCLTDYEAALEKIFGKVGVRDAYCEIKRRVLEKIAEVYPFLENECKKQIESICPIR